MDWPVVLDFSPEGRRDLAREVGRSLAHGITSGRLRPGTAVPSSRELARALGVHRNTVLTAYGELEAQGLLIAEQGRGTFVSSDLPEVPRVGRRRRATADCGFSLHPKTTAARDTSLSVVGDGIPMGYGVPDLRLLRPETLARAYSRVLRRADRLSLLGYSDPQGDARLRMGLCDMLNRLRGFDAKPDEVLVTRGSQMALDLVARELVRPGARVAVEALGYAPAWQAFANAGATLVPIPVDQHGMKVAELEKRITRSPIRAVYVTPHHQYPTTGLLVSSRRQRLLALAREHRFAIIEDDYDNEMHYEGKPVMPIAASDAHGFVVYVGTLSKVFAPHIRVGYLVASRSLVERLVARRRSVDGGGDGALERAVAELLEDEEIQRHARRIRRIYRDRRDAVMHLLSEHLDGVVMPRRPRGGMALWARTMLDTNRLAEAAAQRGVHVTPGKLFRFDRRRDPHLRIGFAACTENELAQGVRALAQAVRDIV